MKLYLYFAAIRTNHLPYSMASYETIFARTRIPERDIRRAISVLIAVGLLEGVDREHSQTRGVNEPNKYYLKGYPALVLQRSGDLPAAKTTPETSAIATA
jgi:hypothetical protein